MTRAPFRLFRTGLIGSVIVALAAGGHLAGGGRLPEPAILAALCAVALVPVAVVTRFRLSYPALTALLGVGQAWLHWSFDNLSAAAGMTGSRKLGSDHAGHVAAALHAAAALPAQGHQAAMPGLPADMETAMFAAHVVATLGTALLLARGEQALAAVGAWFRPLLRFHEPSAIAPVRVPGPCAATPPLSQDRLGLRLPARRGPPAAMPAA
jgi:hypothetical protein